MLELQSKLLLGYWYDLEQTRVVRTEVRSELKHPDLSMKVGVWADVVTCVTEMLHGSCKVKLLVDGIVPVEQ